MRFVLNWTCKANKIAYSHWSLIKALCANVKGCVTYWPKRCDMLHVKYRPIAMNTYHMPAALDVNMGFGPIP